MILSNRYNQQGHCSSNCPLPKQVQFVEEVDISIKVEFNAWIEEIEKIGQLNLNEIKFLKQDVALRKWFVMQ